MGLLSWIESEDMDYGLILVVVGILLIIVSLSFMGVTENKIFSWLFALAPIWLPILSFLVFFSKYMDMVGKLFYLNAGRVTVEVVLPPEVYKSPEAMENVLTQIYNKATQDNVMETYLQGKRPQVVSLELVSRGGDVHFYINAAAKKGVNYVEKALYAQYPGIEVRRLPVDYTAEIPGDMEGYFVFTGHLVKAAKSIVYPIKTYIDLKLTDLPKEEEKVDPLTQMLEYLGSIKPHEQLWFQWQLKAHRDGGLKHGYLHPKETWNKEAEAVIDKLMQRDGSTKAGPVEFEGMPRMTPGERDTVEAIERNVEKTAYDVDMRFVYITEEGKFDGDMIGGILRSYAAWDIAGRAKLGIRWRTDFNYKFISDPFGSRLKALRKQELKEYKLRKLFPKNTAYTGSVMSVEELATIWHPVGTTALTPTLNRVPSAKHQAPANLPIGPA